MLPNRTEYADETLNRRLAHSEEEAQRFDLRLVLRGDERLRSRWFEHRQRHGVTRRFVVDVPLDPAVPVPARPARLSATGASGAGKLTMWSGGGSPVQNKLGVGAFFALGGRLHMVMADSDSRVDYTLPPQEANAIDIPIHPALTASAARTVRVDFAPRIPVKHTADEFRLEYGEQGVVTLAFTVRNDV